MDREHETRYTGFEGRPLQGDNRPAHCHKHHHRRGDGVDSDVSEVKRIGAWWEVTRQRRCGGSAPALCCKILAVAAVLVGDNVCEAGVEEAGAEGEDAERTVRLVAARCVDGLPPEVVDKEEGKGSLRPHVAVH